MFWVTSKWYKMSDYPIINLNKKIFSVLWISLGKKIWWVNKKFFSPLSNFIVFLWKEWVFLLKITNNLQVKEGNGNLKQTIVIVIWLYFQALGCLLYMLCFGNHPFEDSAKLRIINANYSIPSTDTQYKVLHNLISKWFHHKHLSLIGSEDIYVYGY